MKSFKLILAAAFVVVGLSATAQVNFDDPKYAVWGETADERKQNMLDNQFMKEAVDNRNYNLAAKYLQSLLEKCPKASQNIYTNGIKLYKNKINRARSLEEKAVYVDSLLLMYDLRAKYFGDHPKRGTAYILDQKAREVLTYKPSDRAAIREAFRAAIESGCPFVMVGHIETPNFAGDGLPASLSPVMMTDVLRGDLGFEGIVISDSFAMGAITQNYSPADAAVRFFQAGGDMLLMPADLRAAYQGVLDAVHAGTLTEERVDESVLRILTAKDEAGLLA